MSPLDASPMTRAAPLDRPLLGLTILLVEDSRLACEAMRLLCLRSGARLRRADSLFTAERHLRTYRPGAAIIDLGLPDGSGLDLIRRLHRASPRIDAILATSGDDALEGRAMAAGADGFLAKPVLGLAAFQAAILARLPAGARPSGPRAIPEGRIEPDPVAYRDDLCHASELLTRAGAVEADYVAQFLSGVARSAGDQPLQLATTALAQARAQGRDGAAEVGRLIAALAERLTPAPVI